MPCKRLLIPLASSNETTQNRFLSHHDLLSLLLRQHRIHALLHEGTILQVLDERGQRGRLRSDGGQDARGGGDGGAVDGTKVSVRGGERGR